MRLVHNDAQGVLIRMSPVNLFAQFRTSPCTVGEGTHLDDFVNAIGRSFLRL